MRGLFYLVVFLLYLPVALVRVALGHPPFWVSGLEEAPPRMRLTAPPCFWRVQFTRLSDGSWVCRDGETGERGSELLDHIYDQTLAGR